MNNRIRQFFDQIKYQNMDVDDVFLEKYLNGQEKALFARLKIADQNHSILVGKALQNDQTLKGLIDYDKVIKAGLFHDIGKSIRPLSLVEKGLCVVSHKITGKKLKRWASFDGVASYLYHGERGAEILRREKIFKDNPIFYEVIKTHHWTKEKIEKEKDGEKILPYHFILKQADDQF